MGLLGIIPVTVDQPYGSKMDFCNSEEKQVFEMSALRRL